MTRTFDTVAPADWCDEARAIELLGLAERPNPAGTLRRLCRTGLPCYRPLRSVLRFREGELLAWLAAQRYARVGRENHASVPGDAQKQGG